MKIAIRILLLFVLSSCFFMPLSAPHDYKYYATTENKFVNEINVFSTPKIKTYHFKAKENLKIKGCSKIFQEHCNYFGYNVFFGNKKYTREVKINDHIFLKQLQLDTLQLFINDTKILFVPVLK